MSNRKTIILSVVAIFGSIAISARGEDPAPETGKATADSVTTEHTANRELMDATRKIAELSSENQALQSALETALPFAEAGIESQQKFKSGGIESIAIGDVKRQINALKSLAPYSEKIKKQADMLRELLIVVQEYTECDSFDKYPYSRTMTDSIENRLLDLYDAGADILSKAQLNQIDSLYKKADKYRDAVADFDMLIKAVDAETEQFRDNDNADNICAQETERILSEKEPSIQQINRYRYLAELLQNYCNELKAKPRSRTEKIRETVKTMLNASI